MMKLRDRAATNAAVSRAYRTGEAVGLAVDKKADVARIKACVLAACRLFRIEPIVNELDAGIVDIAVGEGVVSIIPLLNDNKGCGR